ncbi:MAG: CPBP family intramembrane metalloprotease [Anaerolineae bacterium]|nr:CPBP family intramembrane metalloprotease [Anaerolineae bacterium]
MTQMTPGAETRSARLTELLRAVLRSNAARAYAAVWLLAALYLLVRGQGQQIGYGVIWLVTIAILGSLTALFTDQAPADKETTPGARRWLWWQLGALAVFILLTAYSGAVFHSLAPADARVPLWSSLAEALERIGSQTFGNENYLKNPVTYFVLPAIVLVLLRARFVSLGFERGHRVLRVIVIWCTLPALVILVQIVGGSLSVERVLNRFISNGLQNGFFEEFLFRGALQTRLRKLWNSEWALVLQALTFGLWHLGLGYSSTGSSDVIAAAASTIMIQASIGLGFGIIFSRSRNLLASSVFHVLVNSMGI